MSTLQERFSLAIKHYEKTSGKRFVKAHLADYCGVSRPAVSEWIDKNVQTLEQDNAEKAARFLGVNHRWLNGLSPSMLEDATPPNNSTPDIPHRPVIA
jgi:predicted XRE-type DNA-binding protein